jgi:hypothetical protein
VRAPRPSVLSGLLAAACATAQVPGEVSPDALFAGALPRLDLRLEPAALKALEKDPREWADFVLVEAGGATLKDCHIKLKGSAGSFRPITDPRPGFSIRTDKTLKKQEFRGLGKFQLNNCAQDGTMLLEMLAGEMARKAGVPASRCTHAWVSLNGKPLGPYVLKEGFNSEFLSYFFKDTKGHLYDGGFVADIRPDMEVDRGDPKDSRRLKELIGACQEPDPAKRAERLNAVLDVDAYLRHLAMEQVFSHWDGYSFNRNNYRLFENRADGRFHFILHGMDQVFGDDRWYVFRRPGGLVPDALWSYPAIRARYREQFVQVYERALRPIDWPRRALVAAEAVQLRLRPVSAEESKRFTDRGREASERIARRLDYAAAAGGRLPAAPGGRNRGARELPLEPLHGQGRQGQRAGLRRTGLLPSRHRRRRRRRLEAAARAAGRPLPDLRLRPHQGGAGGSGEGSGLPAAPVRTGRGSRRQGAHGHAELALRHGRLRGGGRLRADLGDGAQGGGRRGLDRPLQRVPHAAPLNDVRALRAQVRHQ